MGAERCKCGTIKIAGKTGSCRRLCRSANFGTINTMAGTIAPGTALGFPK
jgi:hypothetical protein